jgi:S-DNA-T family DNA segregation ATPase FtsK/SpoIIIE
MELLLEVQAGSSAPTPVLVRIDPQASVDELVAALSGAVGASSNSPSYVERTGKPLRTGPVGRAGLRTGDTVRLGGAAGADRTPTARFELIVVGGIHAGRRLPMPPGEYVVGRDPACALIIDDSEASRRHLHLGVGSHEVVVTDLGSSNGTTIDGQPLTGSAPLGPGQVVRIGATLLAIEPVVGETGSALSERDGWLYFDRPPRVRQGGAGARVALPMVPTPVAKRRLPLSASLVPVAVGGVLAYFLGPVMLLFSIMGPVMAVASLLEDRRTGRRDYAKKLAEFSDRMAAVEPEARLAHDRVVQARREAAPSSATLAHRAVEHTAELWQRRPADPDFLALRIGSADLPSALAFDQPYNDQGEPELTAQTEAVRAAHTIDACVPVDVDLRAVGVLGVAGRPAARQAVVRSLIVQLATLASPRDLALVVLCPPQEADAWAFTRWLPHTTTLVGTGDARTVASAEADLRVVLQVVDDLIGQRRIDAQRKLGFGDEGFSPHVVVLVPGSIPVPRATLARVFASGVDFGVSVLVGAGRAEQLPGECRCVVTADDALAEVSVVAAATGDRIGGVLGDGCCATVAGRVAHALAPVRDVTAAGAAGEVPRGASLSEVLAIDGFTPDQVTRLWSRSRDNGLAAPVGVGAAGVVWLDLRRDGPHGLVAGTTGAGKSELLQSLVTCLAASHPASRLTFVLVDYKGGAAFADCVALPHTVGFFTDLDPHLARRALVSLNAELRRREEILREHGAKDIIDMESRFAAKAPANLLLVFDEFAFLKKEVPEFVAGVVDIAQRGRSLGVHLILATQRPSGVVDDHIRANTNLRIALRIADEADSTDVIDRPDAAHIPKSLPGRAYVRTGHSDITILQAAFGGARSGADGPTRIATSVAPFPFASGLSRTAGASSSIGDDRPTDLQNLVAAVLAAHRDARIPDQPPPWLAPLGDAYPLNDLAHDLPLAAGRLTAVVGMLDVPAAQARRVFAVDLDELGHLLVFGTAGSGKTTVLRTIAAGLAGRLSPEELHLYALDFGSRGLQGLTALPHCGGVVDAEDRERTERLFAMLDELIGERRRLLGEVGAASLAEYRESGGRAPYVVVLLDGYGAFNTTYLNVDHGELVERLARIVAEGRSVGLHLIVTADRRNAISSNLSGVMPGRIVLRMADPDEYAAMGMPMALADADLPPGRGFIEGEMELQVGYVGPEATGPGQRLGLEALAASLPRDAAAMVPQVHPLPERVARAELTAVATPGALRPVIGLSGRTYAPSFVDFDDVPTFIVFGPDRSGRSSALATLVAGAWASCPGLESYLLAPRRSPLLQLTGWTRAGSGADECDELAVDLGDLIRERGQAAAGGFLVVVDDADELLEGSGSLALETVAKRGRDAGLRLLVAVQTHTAHRTFGGWLTEARKAKHGIILAPDIDVDGDLLGTRLPRKTGRSFPAGRGYLVRRGAVELVQVALT